MLSAGNMLNYIYHCRFEIKMHGTPL